MSKISRHWVLDVPLYFMQRLNIRKTHYIMCFFAVSEYTAPSALSAIQLHHIQKEQVQTADQKAQESAK